MSKTKNTINPNVPKPKDDVKRRVSNITMEDDLREQFFAPNTKKPTDAPAVKEHKPWKLQLPETTWREIMKDLTFLQRCIFIELLFYKRIKKNCWPSQKKIAKNLNADITTIEKNMPAVIRKMKLKVIKKNGRSNNYEFPPPF